MRTNHFQSAKKLQSKAAIESGQLVSVNSVQPYNGTIIVTVFGEDEEGEENAVFVDDSMKMVLKK